MKWLKWCGFALIGIGGGAAAAWVSCFWGQWRGHDSQGSAIRNLVLTTASIVALWLAVWRSIVASRQLDTQQHQLQHQQRSLVNDRYQRAADMLDSKTMAVRLGGIHALGQLSEEEPQDYHIPVMELLTAFVRHARPELKDGAAMLGSEDLEVALWYVRRQQRRDFLGIEINADYHVDLSGARLQKAMLRGAHLAHAILIGADLIGADLSRADLSNAGLNDTKLNAANLSGANLSGAHFFGAQLNGAILTNAVLRNCVGLTQAQLDSAQYTDDEPPDLSETRDATTRRPLVWRRSVGPQMRSD